MYTKRMINWGSAQPHRLMPNLNLVLLLLLLHILGTLTLLSCAKYADDISTCPALESRAEDPPVSIHDLRPDDFKVVMALGDSIMSGLGAKAYSILDNPLIQEYRGLSFAAGGDPHAATLPNFIRHYRADVVGASRGSHLVELCHDRFCPPDEFAYRPATDVFNAAQTGATIANIGLETKYLLEQVRHHRLVNVTSDWKLLTVFIGNNDACHHSCRIQGKKEGEPGTPDNFEERLWASLERFRERIPRTLVVLMLLPDASQAHWFVNRHNRCIPSQWFVRMECPCAMESEQSRWDMRLYTAELNDRIAKVAKRINDAVAREQPDSAKQDFAAILMPFMKDTDLRDDIPQHFISKMDCFHPSNTAHKSMAITFWNSLFTAEKDTRLSEQTQIFCPEDSDRILTH